jgi:hypothetical protein
MRVYVVSMFFPGTHNLSIVPIFPHSSAFRCYTLCMFSSYRPSFSLSLSFCDLPNDHFSLPTVQHGRFWSSAVNHTKNKIKRLETDCYYFFPRIVQKIFKKRTEKAADGAPLSYCWRNRLSFDSFRHYRVNQETGPSH